MNKLTADEVIHEITEVLSESSEMFIEKIANQVLSKKVTYQVLYGYFIRKKD